jgi:hypothetical protein
MSGVAVGTGVGVGVGVGVVATAVGTVWQLFIIPPENAQKMIVVTRAPTQWCCSFLGTVVW